MHITWGQIISGVGMCLIAVVAAIILLFAAPQAGAADVTRALTLSPLRTELNIAPGTAQDGQLKVSNTTDKPLLVTLSAESFRVVNDNYDYAFDQETEASKWVTFTQASFSLQKDEERTVGYTIGVPLMAEPGGRYISLFASSDTADDSGVISSRQRVGSLVYITVLGNVTRLGEVVSLTSPSIVINNDQKWSVSIRNGGTTHFRSRYNVVVQNVFGGETVATQAGSALLLPGTIRRITDTIPVPPLPGVYKVTYTIGLGDSPGHVETKYVFYVSPVVIVVSLLAIILILALIFQGRRNINII